MKLSLDTHVFLWWIDKPELISVKAREAISDDTNLIYVSTIVFWEITIKRGLKKLEAPQHLERFMEDNCFIPLPIIIPHALAVAALPNLHSDPFDRLLVAQAEYEGMTLISRDRRLADYGFAHILA